MLSAFIYLTMVTTALCSNSATEKNTTVCYFESGLCGWTNDVGESSDDQNWLQRTASGNAHGPHNDHTYGVAYGKYITIDPQQTTLRTQQRRAVRITSPHFLPDDKYCVQFYYTLTGLDADVINVHAKVFGGLGYPILKLPRSGNGQWLYAETEIDSEYTSTHFQIVMEVFLSSYKIYDCHFNCHYVFHKTDVKVAVDDVFVTNSACADVPRCPQGSDVAHYGDITSCLFINTTAVSWDDAVKSCKNASPFAHLVSIESEEKQKRVVNFLKNSSGAVEAAQHGIWTSGSDTSSEGTWIWTNTQAAFNYTDWKLGQPNNVGDRQDCLALDYPTDNYSWGDEFCSDKRPFICETRYNTNLLDHS